VSRYGSHYFNPRPRDEKFGGSGQKRQQLQRGFPTEALIICNPRGLKVGFGRQFSKQGLEHPKVASPNHLQGPNLSLARDVIIQAMMISG